MGLLDLFGHKYPFTDFHELNLDWCITAVLQLQKAFEDFSAGNKLIFADPLQHDLTKTYAKNTIVVNPVSGTAYLSLDVVPKGVQLDNEDYWLPVFDFAGYVTRANQNFTDNYFSGTDRTPIPLSVGDWVVLDDVLYKVAVAMAADDLFIIGTNIIHFTVEQFLKDFVTSVTNTLTEYSRTIQQYKDDIDASELQYKEDIDASELAYRNQLAQDIADTTANLQAQLNAAIAGVTVDSEVINARVDNNSFTYATLGEAIRSQFDFVNDNLEEFGAYEFIKGYRIACTSVVTDLIPTVNNFTSYLLLDVTEGDEFYIRGYDNNNYYLWAEFYQDENTLTRINTSPGGNTVRTQHIVIPAGVNKLVVNNRDDEYLDRVCIKKVVASTDDIDIVENEISDLCLIRFTPKGRVRCNSNETALTPVLNNNCSYIILDVTEGETYYIRSWNEGPYYSWAVFNLADDQTLTRLSVPEATIGMMETLVTIPKGGNKLVVNNRDVDYSDKVCIKKLPSTTGVHIRVGSYNVGNFTGIGFVAGSDEGQLLIRKAIATAEADVWGLQFDVQYYNSDDSITPRDSVFKMLQYYNEHGTGLYNYKALGGYYPIKNVRHPNYLGPFDYPARHTWFLVGDLYVEGYRIGIASIHLDWSDKYTRRQQIAEVINFMDDYTYSIIIGDINPDNYYEGERVADGLSEYESHMLMLSEELPLWTAGGYKIANVGDLGPYNTIISRSVPANSYPCDNIFISQNLYFNNVDTVVFDYMNDHAILWADVSMN